MATAKKTVKKGRRRHRKQQDFKTHEEPIVSLGMFFRTLDVWLKKGPIYWFRGHANRSWTLTPSALRYKSVDERNRALHLLADFRRYAEIRLPNPPGQSDELKWVQLARHYGLPTRLLDWTGNASIALYFACESDPQFPDHDGAVYILKPEDLNREADIKNARIFDACSDEAIIKEYLGLSGARDPRGLKTIAINPVWNSERITLQQGTFTLHGSKEFTLTFEQAPSVVRFIIPTENKHRLRDELERTGINEMSIFPEPEHMCRYLVWRERLNVLGAQ